MRGARLLRYAFAVLVLTQSTRVALARPLAAHFLREHARFSVGDVTVSNLSFYHTHLLATREDAGVHLEQYSIALRDGTIEVGEPAKFALRLHETLLIAEFGMRPDGTLLSLRIPRLAEGDFEILSAPPLAGGHFRSDGRGILTIMPITFRADGQHDGRFAVTYPSATLDLRLATTATNATATFSSPAPVTIAFDCATETTQLTNGTLRSTMPVSIGGTQHLAIDTVDALATGLELLGPSLQVTPEGTALVADELTAAHAEVRYLPHPSIPVLPLAYFGITHPQWLLRPDAVHIDDVPRVGDLVMNTSPEAFLEILHDPNVPEQLVPTGDPRVKFISSRPLWATYRALAAAQDEPSTHRVIRLDISNEAITDIELLDIPIAGEFQAPPMTTFAVNVDEFPRNRSDPMRDQLPKAIGLMVRRALFPILVRRISAPLVLTTFLTLSNPVLATGVALSIVGATYLTTYAADYATRAGVKFVLRQGVKGAMYLLTAPSGASAPPYPPIPPPTAPDSGDIPQLPPPQPQPHPTPDEANAARFRADRAAAAYAIKQTAPSAWGTPYPSTTAATIIAARDAAAAARTALSEKDATWRIYRKNKVAELEQRITATEQQRGARMMQVDGVSGSQSDATAEYHRAVQARIKQQSGQFVGGPPQPPGASSGWGSGGQFGGPGSTNGGNAGVPGGTQQNVPHCQSINELCYRYRRP